MAVRTSRLRLPTPSSLDTPSRAPSPRVTFPDPSYKPYANPPWTFNTRTLFYLPCPAPLWTMYCRDCNIRKICTACAPTLFFYCTVRVGRVARLRHALHEAH